MLDNRLELSASTSIALDSAESIDLPARHRIGARYALTENVRIVGLYELADGAEIDAEAVIELCRAELAGYKRPKGVLFVGMDDLPRSVSGKILREEVEKLV